MASSEAPAPSPAVINVPERIRAAIYDASCSPHGIRVVDDYPAPKLNPHGVLVKVAAAAINPVDYKLPSLPVLGSLLKRKAVGLDFAGDVVAVGEKVSDSFGFRAGDRIFGITHAKDNGSLCEYIVADPKKIAKIPESLSVAEAASLPLVALTSYQAFADHGLKSGDRVLVIGASGGTGQMGVQLAKSMGASFVVGVCSEQNAELVKDLGADEVVDYKQHQADILAGVSGQKPFDFVYDCVTSPEDFDYTTQMDKLLGKEGRKYIAINGSMFSWTRALLGAQWGKYTLLLYSDKKAGEELKRMSEWIADGKLRTRVDCKLPFTQEGIDEGFARLKSRRAQGKVVFDF